MITTPQCCLWIIPTEENINQLYFQNNIWLIFSFTHDSRRFCTWRFLKALQYTRSPVFHVALLTSSFRDGESGFFRSELAKKDPQISQVWGTEMVASIRKFHVNDRKFKKRMKTTLKTYPFHESICRQFIRLGAFSCHVFQNQCCVFQKKQKN